MSRAVSLILSGIAMHLSGVLLYTCVFWIFALVWRWDVVSLKQWLDSIGTWSPLMRIGFISPIIVWTIMVGWATVMTINAKEEE